MTALDPTGPAPETRQPRFLWLLFGCTAAPLAWLGQMMLCYGLTTAACYPGDHPISAHAPVSALLAATDIAALVLCAGGAFMSWRGWRQVRSGRNHFLALWGLMSSLWFLAAVLFNVIASLVPPCAG